MSYVANGEKVFLYQNPVYANCTLPAVRRSDHRLKRFQSVLDKRAWNFCEEVRSRHFRDLISGSQTCLGVDPCHRYVPLEDLVKILMGQKEHTIKNLEQQKKGGTGGQDLKTQTAGLKEELNKSRDMLRKAMHKLENIDEIMNENKKLQCRLRCSEEKVKRLEDKKKHLESELADLRSKSQIQIDLEKAQKMLYQINNKKSAEIDEAVLHCLSLERDELQDKVKKLEKELEESKKKDAEIEVLKKQSQCDSIDREEMSRENECYRKKLASMKCLEKQIQELKKQGKALADKYKREAQKAAEQMNKMCLATKELQGLRDERDSLRKRVNELASYECQYKKLQRKLQRVDAVIAENETLNCKLLALEKLEKENEYLRCRLEAIQEMEMNAAGDKEKIVQLQCAVADQEEEMKDLLGQIERLTSGKNEEELERLKCELYEKNSRLKLCEEQLAEIPMLEAEIDELRMKLQSCCKEFPDKKRGERSYQKVQVRLPASSTGICADYKTPGEYSSVLGIRREERVELKSKYASCQEISQVDTGRECKVITEMSKKGDVMSCDEVQNLLQSSKGIISCVLDDMREHQKEMEELETCNKIMKEEIETLKAKVGGSDKDCLLQEINKLKRALEEKDQLICKLKESAPDTSGGEDIEAIKELNRQMKVELEAACVGLKQVAHLERMLGKQQGKDEEEGAEGSSKRSRAIEEFDSCKALQKETDDLKLQVEALNKLTEELKKENELLRELQQPCPDFSKELDEKCALENLLSLLQAELDAFKGQKLSDECEALRMELKRVMEQNCQLKTLVDCYRQRLNLEKESNELTGQQPGGAFGTGKFPQGTTDCMKELEQLRKEKNVLQQKLDMVAKGIPLSQIKIEMDDGFGAPDKGMEPSGPGAGADVKSGAGGKGMGLSGSGAGAGADERSGAEGIAMGASGPGAGADERSGAGGKGMGPSGSGAGADERTGAGGKGMGASGPGADADERSGAGGKGMGPSGPGAGEDERSGAEGTGMGASGPGAGADERSGAGGKGMGASGPGAGADERSGAEGTGMGASGPGAGADERSGAGGKGMGASGPGAGADERSGAGGKGMGPSGPGAGEDERSGAEGTGMGASGPGAGADERTGAGGKGMGASGPGAGADERSGAGAEGTGMGPSGPGADEKSGGAPEIKTLPDCLKELEKLRKEKYDLKAQLAAGPGTPAECEEKLKKLMDQHNKELADREKKYNDNLNAMKMGYETDIRKLADRHKQSIIKLQDLHEGEIREMSMDFEKQLDESQTALNDLAKTKLGRGGKTPKEDELLGKLGTLQNRLNRSKEELDALRKNMKPNAGELQKARRASQQKLNAMKKVLDEERRKSESLKQELKEKGGKEGVCDCKFSKKKPPKPRDPSCPLDFNEVLEKILEEGLDSLTFNEIALVHRKTCCALEGIVMNSNGRPILELEPPVGETCMHTPLLEADKQQLLSKIFALENDIMQKQKETQETIISMELAIKKERCRLQEVKNSLQNEQQRNSELKLLLSSQTKIQADLKKERDQLGNQASFHQSLCEEKSKRLDEEVRTKKYLEGEIERLRCTLKQLRLALDAQRENSGVFRAENIEVMRSQLEKSTHQERKLAVQLEKETKCRMQLQYQLQSLRQSLKHTVNLPSSGTISRFSQNPLEAKSAKERQNMDQINESKNKTKTKTPKKSRK